MARTGRFLSNMRGTTGGSGSTGGSNWPGIPTKWPFSIPSTPNIPTPKPLNGFDPRLTFDPPQNRPPPLPPMFQGPMQPFRGTPKGQWGPNNPLGPFRGKQHPDLIPPAGGGTARSTAPGKHQPPQDRVPIPPMRRPHPSDERWGGQPHGFFDPPTAPWNIPERDPADDSYFPNYPRFPGGPGYMGWQWLRHPSVREWAKHFPGGLG